MYGGASGSAPGICPGEADCERYGSAAGATPQIREQNACRNCELFPTKIRKAELDRQDAFLDNALFRALVARRERALGKHRAVSAVVFTVLMAVEEEIEDRERELRLRQDQMLELLLKRPGL